MQQTMQLPNFKKVKSMVIEESKFFERFGIKRTFAVVQDILKDDDLVIEFMTDPNYGGYSRSAVRRIQDKINR